MIASLRQFSRQSTIAVAVFVGLLMTVIIGETATLWTNRALRNEFDSKSEIFTRMGGKDLSNPGVNRSLALGPTRLAALSAPTETVAASQLHQIVLTALDQVGGSVHSIQAEANSRHYWRWPPSTERTDQL